MILKRKWYPGNRFIPPELGLDAPTRRAVLKAAGDRWMFQTRNGLWALAWFLGAIVVSVLVMVIFWPLLKSTGLVPGNLVFVPLGVCWVLYLHWQQRNGLPQCVYAELRDRGHDVCRQCGYLRKGLDAADPCPECGTRSAPLPVH